MRSYRAASLGSKGRTDSWFGARISISSGFGCRRTGGGRCQRRVRGWAPDRLDRDRGAGKLESGLLEGRDEALDRFALHIGWPGRLDRQFEAHHHRVVGDVGDPLQLQRLQEVILQFGVCEHRLTDLLRYLAQFIEIGVAVESQVELQRGIVATEVGDLSELPEGD